jgi:hypothetical protein
MRKLTLLFVLILSFSGCSEDDSPGIGWRTIGLEGKIVNELRLLNNILFAATDDGLYKKDISAASPDFISIGFAGKNVQSILIFTEEQILASVFDRANAYPPGLFKTNDGGSVWEELENNFGGIDQEPILDLEIHPHGNNTIYATGWQVVAKSIDGGITWDPIWGDWGGFGTGTSIVAISHHEPHEIWAGGQGGIENGYLLRSEDESTWDSWYDLVENPTVVKKIAFDPSDHNVVYAGYEGALIGTSDGGSSWNTLVDSDENRFFFGISVSENKPGRIYAGGWLKRFDDPQPLRIFYSDDKGATWNSIDSPRLNEFAGVYDMVLKSETGVDKLFLGLYKGGVVQMEFPVN